jgi:hypothetical protein
MVPRAGVEPARVIHPRDFKSLASTCFATWAYNWRLRPESNRRPRLCRPLHNHSATQPCLIKRLKKSDFICRNDSGAGNETRTRDPNLGKVVLYQLSYSRVIVLAILPKIVKLSTLMSRFFYDFRQCNFQINNHRPYRKNCSQIQ